MAFYRAMANPAHTNTQIIENKQTSQKNPLDKKNVTELGVKRGSRKEFQASHFII